MQTFHEYMETYGGKRDKPLFKSDQVNALDAKLKNDPEKAEKFADAMRKMVDNTPTATEDNKRIAHAMINQHAANYGKLLAAVYNKILAYGELSTDKSASAGSTL